MTCRSARRNVRKSRHYRFLTSRPLLTLLNINEANAGEAEAMAAAHRPAVEPPGAATAAACATLEMELRGLPNEDSTAYREAVGAAEGVLDAAVRLSYQILGCIRFLRWARMNAGPGPCVWETRRCRPPDGSTRTSRVASFVPKWCSGKIC